MAKTARKSEPPPPLPPPVAEKAERKATPPDAGSRLSIPLHADGSVALDRMRGDTRERLAKILADPTTGRQLGISSEAVQVLPAGLGAALVQVVADLDLLIVAKMSGAPLPLVKQVGTWTPEEKAIVAPSLETVLNKYGGRYLGKFGDELALGMLLVSITTQKVAAVRELAAEQKPRAVPVPIRSEPPADDDGESFATGAPE